MEVGLAIGMALFVAVSLGTPGDEARVLFGVFAVAGLRLMPSVRNMMSGWSALKYNRYTIDILRDIDLNDEKPEPSAAQPPLPLNVKSPCATSRSASTTSAATKRCCTG